MSKSIKSIRPIIQDLDYHINNYNAKKKELDIGFIVEANNNYLPAEWHAPENSRPERVFIHINAYKAFLLYESDPYRLLSKVRETAGTFSASSQHEAYKMAFDHLIARELPEFTDRLDNLFDEAGIKNLDASDLSRETLIFIYSCKNEYSPKRIRKHYNTNPNCSLSQQEIECIVEAFSTYTYTPPEVFIC